MERRNDVTARRWILTFLCVLTLITLGLVGAFVDAAWIATRPNYPEEIRDPSWRVQDRGFQLHDTSCDVLIYGDSTASIGLDPRVIHATTGLSACNISAVRPVVDDLGLVPVDAFLEKNPKPRFLVLHFGPELFYRKVSWDHSSPGAPIVMLLRDMPKSEAIAAVLRHPGGAMQFVQFIFQNRLRRPGPDDERRHQAYLKQIIAWQASGGLLSIDGVAQTNCAMPPATLYGPLDVKWIAGLRSKYQAMGIHVIVEASAVPTCDPQLAKFQQELKPYLDAPVETLPIQVFYAGNRHTNAAGTRQMSQRLAALIEARL